MTRLHPTRAALPATATAAVAAAAAVAPEPAFRVDSDTESQRQALERSLHTSNAANRVAKNDDPNRGYTW